MWPHMPLSRAVSRSQYCSLDSFCNLLAGLVFMYMPRNGCFCFCHKGSRGGHESFLNLVSIFVRSCLRVLRCRVGVYKCWITEASQIPVSLLVDFKCRICVSHYPAAHCQPLTYISQACQAVGYGCSNAGRQVSFACPVRQHSKQVLHVLVLRDLSWHFHSCADMNHGLTLSTKASC